MKYKVKYQENGQIKSKYISKNEELPQNVLKVEKSFFHFFEQEDKTISLKSLNELFYELSIMLEAKILLEDAIDILLENQKEKKIKVFLEIIKKSFLNSLDIKEELKSYKINHHIIAFLKLSQSSGDISRNISLLSMLLNENYELKKSLYKTFTYPLILLFSFFFAILAIFNFVIPKFQTMFEQTQASMSFATKSLFFAKDVFDNYFFLISFVVLSIVFLFYFLYQKVDSFVYFLDEKLFNSFFLFSKIYRFKLFYNYFLFIDILLESKYDFKESISKGKVSINNQFFLDRITKVENLLEEGRSISYAFNAVSIFDEVTLNLIRTGELTNSLSITISKINKIYKKRVEDNLKLFSVMVEPIFFLVVMSLIIWIILAIFVPLWNMSEMLKI